MKARSNLLNFASNKADNAKLKARKQRENASQPQSLNDVNFSPQSNSKDSYAPAFSSSPNLDDNTGSDKENMAGAENKSKALPKINNPKAGNRLKALMDLLGRKNPALPSNKISSAKARIAKEDQDLSSFKIKKNNKNNIFLPPLTSFTPKEQNTLEEMKKNFPKSPADVPAIKVNDETKLSAKKSDPLSSQLHRKKIYREYSVPIGNKKKVIFKSVNSKNPNGDESKRSESPAADPLKMKKKVLQVPEPTLNFSTRIHRVSIDDALERLNQLTNQSGNARKDLLRIQENALAIRLSYERNHKSLDKINSERDLRNP